MGAAALALPALEVAIGGGGAALSGRQDVGVHAQTHGAAGHAPVQPRLGEDPVEALFLGLALDLGGAGDDHRVDIGMDLAALYNLGGCTQVLETGVGAGADEDAVDPDVLDRSSRT